MIQRRPPLLVVVASILIAPLAGFIDQPELKVLAVGLLLAPLIFAMVSNRVIASGLTVATLGGLTFLVPNSAAQIAVFAPPIVINCALAWTFGSTLSAGRTPLISLYAKKLHTGMDFPDAAIWEYTRAITGYWALLFIANALIGIVLALLVTPVGLLSIFGVEPRHGIPLAWWALHAYIGCYASCGIFFVLEFAYRKRRFPWQPYGSLVDFLRSLSSLARKEYSIHARKGQERPRDCSRMATRYLDETSNAGCIRARILVEADHPSLPGHFPGNPVVPGVVLLGLVMQALGIGPGEARQFPSVKFTSPMLPGEGADLEATWEGQKAKFSLTKNGHSIMTGVVIVPSRHS